MILMSTEENHVLQALPKKEYERLLPELQFVTLALNQVLYTAHGEIAYGYFLNTGLVSCLTVMKSGASVEVGLVGYEGFVGLPILLKHRSVLGFCESSNRGSGADIATWEWR
jgi:hypothetical protein